jgi:hypothetical protein
MKEKLLLDESPLVFQPTMAEYLGLNEAIVLQQLFYFMNVSKNSEDPYKNRLDRWWTYNSYEEWKQNCFPFWSTKTVERTFRGLVDLGIVMVGRFSRNKYDQRNWYTIDRARLDQVLKMRKAEIDKQSIEEKMVCENVAAPQSVTGGVQIGLVDQDKLSEGSRQNDPMILKNTPENPLNYSIVASDDELDHFNTGNHVPVNSLTVNEENYEPHEDDDPVIDLTPENIYRVAGNLKIKAFGRPTIFSPHANCALKACRRDRFQSEQEQQRWRDIEGDMDWPRSFRDVNVKYPSVWVLHNINLARRLNAAKLVISFPELMTAIEDEESREKWMAKTYRAEDCR